MLAWVHPCGAERPGCVRDSHGSDPDALVRDLQDRFPRAKLTGGNGRFERLVAKVVGFVEAPRIGLDLPLDVRGTVFQQRVWQALCEIPAGETASYTEIARRIRVSEVGAGRGAGLAANPLAVAIPCHRVVATTADFRVTVGA